MTSRAQPRGTTWPRSLGHSLVAIHASKQPYSSVQPITNKNTNSAQYHSNKVNCARECDKNGRDKPLYLLYWGLINYESLKLELSNHFASYVDHSTFWLCIICQTTPVPMLVQLKETSLSPKSWMAFLHLLSCLHFIQLHPFYLQPWVSSHLYRHVML